MQTNNLPIRKRLPSRKKKATPSEQTFALTQEYITLGQLLKAAGILGTGGEIKFVLAESRILVNEEIETRRGRKLREGDIIRVPGETPVRIIAKKENEEDEEDSEEIEDEENESS